MRVGRKHPRTGIRYPTEFLVTLSWWRSGRAELLFISTGGGMGKKRAETILYKNLRRLPKCKLFEYLENRRAAILSFEPCGPSHRLGSCAPRSRAALLRFKLRDKAASGGIALLSPASPEMIHRVQARTYVRRRRASGSALQIPARGRPPERSGCRPARGTMMVV